MNLDIINEDLLNLFPEKWALLTAGSIDKHNSMTIGWGAIGTLWKKPAITVYVKPCRYTYKFMEENEYFVVSFFEEQYKDNLIVMGSVSGKDTNKDELAKLTPVKQENLTFYQEAKVILVCKKIYSEQLKLNQVPEEVKHQYYEVDEAHKMYIGEVVEIIKQ